MVLANNGGLSPFANVVQQSAPQEDVLLEGIALLDKEVVSVGSVADVYGVQCNTASTLLKQHVPPVARDLLGHLLVYNGHYYLFL